MAVREVGIEYEEIGFGGDDDGEGGGEEEEGPKMLSLSPGKTGVVVHSSRRWTGWRSVVEVTFMEIFWKENVSWRCG